MRPQALLPAFVLCSAAAARSLDGPCGSSQAPQEALAAARKVKDASQLSSRALSSNDSLVIPTYLHVVESRDLAGLVTDKMLQDQMRVLNETFKPHRIQFVLRDVSHTVNDEWAASSRVAAKAKALRRGGYDDLNIYFETGLMKDGSVTGLCEFPVEDPANTGINGTSYAVYDGCHVSPGTLPGGSGTYFDPNDNKGKTATHEVGHWFGLFHVFDGFSCDGEGDLIDDTPAMLTATVGCPKAQDSCPDQPGEDPYHNYMDYSSHDCLWEFTPMQEERMHQSFETLRRGKKFQR